MKDHPNHQIALRLWDAIATADVSTLSEVLAPHAVWRMYGRSPLSGEHEGVAGIFAFMATVGELADELESDLQDIFVSNGGAVLVYGVRGRRGEREIGVVQYFRIRIEEGRIVEGTFALSDQDAYDRFWMAATDAAGERADLAHALSVG